MEIGHKIKTMRLANNISQKDLAHQLHMPVSTLANYENNHRKPSIQIIKKIADVLGVSPLIFINTESSFSFDLISAIQDAWVGKNNGSASSDIFEDLSHDLDLDYEIFYCFKRKLTIMEHNIDGTYNYKHIDNEEFNPSLQLPTDIQIKLLDYLYEIDKNVFLKFYDDNKNAVLNKDIKLKMIELSLFSVKSKSPKSIKPLNECKEIMDENLKKYIAFMATLNDVDLNQLQIDKILSKVFSLIDEEIFDAKFNIEI